MKTALELAGIKRYVPTEHAISRASLRYGVKPSEAIDWIGERMKDAKYIGKSGGNAYASVYESIDGIRLVVDDRTNAVITVLSDITADFLRPTLEREKRKLERLYTRNIRKLGLKYAESLKELADMAINRARARNPNTRAIISDRMADKQEDIDGIVSEVERLEDERKAKVRAIEVISE